MLSLLGLPRQVPGPASESPPAGSHSLALVQTIQNNCSGPTHPGGSTRSKHCDGLSYCVQARAYPSSPRDLVVTMRGGGVAVWRWGPEPAAAAAVKLAAPALAVRSFVLPGVPTEGRD